MLFRKAETAPAVFFQFVFFTRVGTWLSLVEHSVRDAGVGGSNPLVPTILNYLVDFSTYFPFLQNYLQLLADIYLFR